jgi:hypothetical protein
MATRVYLDAKSNIVVSKSSGENITARQYSVRATFIGTYPINTAYDYDDIVFQDVVTDEAIEDKISNIRDENGNKFDDSLALKNYLEGFFYMLSSKQITDDCTAFNQEVMIAQNEQIKSELSDILLTEEQKLDIIKEELQENNKLLRKIYN